MFDNEGNTDTMPGVSVQKMYGPGHVQARYTRRGSRERRGEGSRGRVGAGWEQGGVNSYTVPGVSVQEMYGPGHVQTRYCGFLRNKSNFCICTKTKYK